MKKKIQDFFLCYKFLNDVVDVDFGKNDFISDNESDINFDYD